MPINYSCFFHGLPKVITKFSYFNCTFCDKMKIKSWIGVRKEDAKKKKKKKKRKNNQTCNEKGMMIMTVADCRTQKMKGKKRKAKERKGKGGLLGQRPGIQPKSRAKAQIPKAVSLNANRAF